MLSVYETRLPEILQSLRQLNAERLSLLQSVLKESIKRKKERLLAQLDDLSGLEASVQQINVESDLRQFPCIAVSQTEHQAPADGNEVVIDQQSAEKAVSFYYVPQRTKSYSLDLWGEQAFNAVVDHAMLGKQAAKAMLILLKVIFPFFIGSCCTAH